MGGRGQSSASAGASSRNAAMHERYMAGELGTKVTNHDDFLMRQVFPDMNYWKQKESKTSGYAHADRVSPDRSHIVVMVDPAHIRETKYGYALQLDRDNVAYLKSWQVMLQSEPYKGQTGVNVALNQRYFKVSKARYQSNDFAADGKNLTYSEWVKAAEEQQRRGNTVSMRY